MYECMDIKSSELSIILSCCFSYFMYFEIYIRYLKAILILSIRNLRTWTIERLNYRNLQMYHLTI